MRAVPYRTLWTFIAVALTFISVMPTKAALAENDPGKTRVGSVVISEIKFEGVRSMDQHRAAALLGLSPGDTLDPQRLRIGLRRLFLKGIFRDLQAVTATGQDGTALKIVAAEKARITHIDVEGNVNVQTARVKKELSIKLWDFFQETQLHTAVDRLRERLHFFGYPWAEVSAQVAPVNPYGDVIVTIRVVEGPATRIHALEFPGAPNPAKAELKVFVRPGDVMDGEKIERDVERLKKYYQGRGYAGVDVTPSVDEEGALRFVVILGPRVQLFFEGNENFSDDVLQGEVFLGEAGVIGEEAIEESARRIVRFYQREGFAFAGVAAEFEETPDRVKVRFFIHEGVLCIVERIRIVGAGGHENTLRDAVHSRQGKPYSRQLAEDDEDSLLIALNRLGFLSPGIEAMTPDFSDDGKGVILEYRISPGMRSWIREIRMEGMTAFPVEETLVDLGLEEGQPYDEVQVIDGRYRLLDRYLQAGFVTASVNFHTKFTPDGEWATILFDVVEGSRQRFGKVIVRGTRRTRDALVIRELGIEEGALFTPSLIPLGKRALYQLGIFSEVQIDTVDNEPGYKDVVVTVRESKPGSVEFGFGYGDYDRFRVSAEVKYRNVTGVNRMISLRGEYGSQARRLLLTYTDPWSLRTWNLPFRSSLLIERTEEVNSDTREILWQQRRAAFSATVDRDFAPTLKGSFGYEYSFVDTFDVVPDVQLNPEDEGTVGISSLSVSVVRDTRDNPFDPSSGTVTGAVLKVATRFLLSETDFAKLTLQHSRYDLHAYRIVSALSLRVGIAKGLHDTRELPIVERFFLGGRTTVRGYDQRELGPKGVEGNPTGGNAFIAVNAELRMPVWRDLGAVAFVDGGNVWLTAGDLDPTDLRFTAGVGIRYRTPVGPLRLDYGFKLDQKEGESAGELHFSLGHAF